LEPSVIDPLATLAGIEEALSRPVPPGPHTFSSADFPFDEKGRRRETP
jgi:hypothetical protein